MGQIFLQLLYANERRSVVLTQNKRAFSKWGQTILQLLYANEWHCTSVKHEIVQLLLVWKEKWGGLQFIPSCACGTKIIVLSTTNLWVGSAIFAWHLFLSCCSVPVATEKALLVVFPTHHHSYFGEYLACVAASVWCFPRYLVGVHGECDSSVSFQLLCHSRQKVNLVPLDDAVSTWLSTDCRHVMCHCGASKPVRSVELPFSQGTSSITTWKLATICCFAMEIVDGEYAFAFFQTSLHTRNISQLAGP